MARLIFTQTQTKTSAGIEFALRCDVEQTDEETALFDAYDIYSPLEIVFEALQSTAPEGTTAAKVYDRAAVARAEQARIVQSCRGAFEDLANEQRYGGVETVDMSFRR